MNPANEQPRITVWYCRKCGYWRKEQRGAVHVTEDYSDPRGRMITHALWPVLFEMVGPEKPS